jgi:hypothetical protein
MSENYSFALLGLVCFPLSPQLASSRKTSKSATRALKGRGFKLRLTSFSKTYGTAEKPCPFKTRRRLAAKKRVSRD